MTAGIAILVEHLHPALQVIIRDWHTGTLRRVRGFLLDVISL
jgi:hypothetical protein